MKGRPSLSVRRLFALVAWVYVAATILGITDEIAALLDGAGFTLAAFRLSGTPRSIFFCDSGSVIPSRGSRTSEAKS